MLPPTSDAVFSVREGLGMSDIGRSIEDIDALYIDRNAKATAEEAVRDLNSLRRTKNVDGGYAHVLADSILLAVLREHGLKEVADAYVMTDLKFGFQCA